MPILIPNDRKLALEIVKQYNLKGLIFSGGNSLVSLNGDAEERDFLEKELIELSMHNNISIIGVCRGMQIIQEYFGSTFT